MTHLRVPTDLEGPKGGSAPRTSRRPGARALGLWLACASVGLLGACGPRYARISVVEEPGITVTLRAQQRSGQAVERGFAHPVTISGVRLAHILARIDVRKVGRKAEKRGPGIPTELVYGLGDALSKAFAKADSSQEIVVQAIRNERRLGLFSDKHLTGLVAWMEADALVLHLTHVDVPLDKRKREKIPEPWAGAGSDDLKVLAVAHMTALGPRSLSIDWRDASFRKAAAIRLGPGGQLRRRTILLESPEAPAVSGAPSPGALPAALSPEALRALADLEEERRAGAISEGEYAARRRAILESGEGGP